MYLPVGLCPEYNEWMDIEMRILDDLQGLIKNEAHESLHLDFKASDSLGKSDGKKTEISKDVSSFANSDGGTIVYGMIEADHKASQVDAGTGDVDKEWLENVITSNISPRIDGIVIHPVEITSGLYAYIVHIPKSSRAPHQAGDKRFYKRFNFKSVPMEQYEIMDVMNRETAPDLSLDFAWQKMNDGHIYNLAGGVRKVLLNPFELSVKVINKAETPAEYFAVRLYIDKSIDVELPELVNHLYSYDTWDERVTLGNHNIDVTVLQFRWSVHSHGSVWKGEDAEIATTITIDIPRPELGGSYLLAYEVTAPHMAKNKVYRAVHAGLVSRRLSGEILTEDAIIRELAL